MKKHNGFLVAFAVLVISAIFTIAGCDNNDNNDNNNNNNNDDNNNSGPSSMVELGIIGNNAHTSRNAIGSVSSLELHIQGLYLVVKSGPNIPFIHDEGFALANGGPSLSNAVTDPVGWYSFQEVSQIKWRGGINHLQWYTEGLQGVVFFVDNIRINGVEYPGITTFEFPTPTNIPNIYAENLEVMNIFVEVPELFNLSSSPGSDAFNLELVNAVKVSAEIY
jgi:hypothetical protein